MPVIGALFGLRRGEELRAYEGEGGYEKKDL